MCFSFEIIYRFTNKIILMKTLTRLIPFLIFTNCFNLGTVFGQKKQTLFDQENLVWHGLDFSQAKMVGQFAQFKDAGQKNGESIKKIYIGAWNNVIYLEPQKYNLSKAFHVNKVTFSLDKVTEINESIDPNLLMSSGPFDNVFSDAKIQEMTRKYAKTGDGTGIVFLVEKFDKNEDQGTVCVVYFDRKTGDVLFSERMFGKSGGFGIKNYWIKTIYNILNDIEFNKWYKWRRKAIKALKK